MWHYKTDFVTKVAFCNANYSLLVSFYMKMTTNFYCIIYYDTVLTCAYL